MVSVEVRGWSGWTTHLGESWLGAGGGGPHSLRAMSDDSRWTAASLPGMYVMLQHTDMGGDGQTGSRLVHIGYFYFFSIFIKTSSGNP